MVVNFFGKRGSGKTYTIKNGVISDCRPPVVIIDILGNYDGSEYIQTKEIDQCLREIRNYYLKEINNEQTNPVINLTSYDFNLAADYISAALWEINGGTLILDEVDAIDFSESPCFEQNVRYGRNHNIDLITGCRRPAELSKHITAAANKFYCFNTHEHRDMFYFEEIFGERAYELMRCPEHSGLFLDYDKKTIGRFYVDSSGGIHHAGEGPM